MQLIKLKTGVNVQGIHPHLWLHLGIAARIFYVMFIFPLTVTSMRRGYKKGVVSKHSPGIWTIQDWVEYLWGEENHEGTPLFIKRPPLASAVDISRRAPMAAKPLNSTNDDMLPISRAEEFCRTLQGLMGDQIGVVLEPEWLSIRELERRGGLSKVVPHIHIQSKKTHLFNKLSQVVP